MENITLGTALGLSVIGFLTVFIVLILLMTIIYIMGAIMKSVNSKNEAKNAETAPAAPITKEAPPVPAGEPAKGSCGDLTLVKVSERDAAMIMAIVANQLNTPLNELRFISIKEAE